MGKLSKLASALDMSKKARMQRAQEMGFYDNTVYHGTAAKPTTVMSDGNIFDEFKLWEGEDPTRSTVRSPVSKLGVSLAEQPKIADSFASLASQNGSEGSAVLPLRFRADQVGHIDLDGRELNEEIFGTVADSWKSGFDAIQFRNYNIDGKNGSFVLVKDPSQIRSVNAAFDPAKKDSSNLMAGVTGAAVGAGALMQGEDAEASFLGKGAKMANKAALEIARKMKDTGATQDEIFEKTGWFQGADDAWRFEVDDSQMIYNEPTKANLGYDYQSQLSKQLNDYRSLPDSEIKREMDLMDFDGSVDEYRKARQVDIYSTLDDITKGDGYIQADVLENSPLSQGYPQTDVNPVNYKNQIGFNDSIAGSFNPQTGQATIKPGNPDNLSILAHENQHVIQELEGFARGGSVPDVYPPGERDKYISSLARSIKGKAGNKGATSEQIIEQAGRIADSRFGREQYYRKLAGEVEARNVQGRLHMSPEERKLLPPWTTEDVPRSEQIVKFGLAPALVGGSVLFSPEQAMASANEFRQRREGKKDKWRQLRGRDRKTQATGKAAPVEHEFLADLANKFSAYNDWTESKPGLDFILPRAPAELVDKWSYGQPTTWGDDISAALDLM